ncbi:hypothetical protein RI845_13625 [Thalassotalea nanhaiensis]|uniref:Helix-turn-helix domain-containing protein n=1 Tax=Thalassotalea nanhaiensis TaxID=3065648 RepID=A0ABY9TFK9_9GAMM|nr:hypothetical protein RI845_13625 [Colwelliaceae bacterium SQ345]
MMLSHQEACQYLNVTRKTLWVYRTKHPMKHLIKCNKLSHKKIEFCKDSLKQFNESIMESAYRL